MQIRYLDRSRRVAWEHCPRERYWQYEHGGRGIRSARENIAFLTGRIVHTGVEELLQGAEVEQVVKCARASYEGDLLLDIGYGQTPPENVLEEQQALAEAILQAFAIVKLPELQAIGQVIDIEREEQVTLYQDASLELRLLTRADTVIRHGDGHCYIHNFKTVSDPDERWRQQWQHDTCTLAEVLATEARMGEKLGGVVIEGLVKGRKARKLVDGQWFVHHDSPLLYAYHKAAEPPFPDEWTHVTQRTKGWSKLPTWKAYPGGTAGWIAKLQQDSPEVLREQFVTLPAIVRSDYDIDEWRNSVVAEESFIATACRELNEDGLFTAGFPKHPDDGNCTFPGKCSCYELCWGTAGADPLSSGFEWRKPNHPTEVIADGR